MLPNPQLTITDKYLNPILFILLLRLNECKSKMKGRLHIPVYTEEKDKKMIEEASKIVSLNASSFCRTSAIKEARRILAELKKENDTKQTLQH